ncbi:MAG: aminotransferase class V-fold PLP-dependent enzyme [Armatimonadota bacterium]
MIASLEGAHDADFLRVLAEARRLALRLFQSDGGAIGILPALEEAACEAVLSSLLPPQSVVIVGVCGACGERHASTARHLGLAVHTVDAPRGAALSIADLARAVEDRRPAAVLLVHGEGSTGVLQPLIGLGDVCRRHETLLLTDASFTLSGVDLAFDAWAVDAAWSGTQRCLSALPGLCLVALSPRALDRLTPVTPSHLHLRRAIDGQYDTFPAPLLYALDEVLQLSSDQGLAYRFSRHINRQVALIAGLEALNLEIVAHPDVRLPSVTAVRVPGGVDGAWVAHQLLARFRLEIGGPVDPAVGPVWRIGIMGHSAAPSSILLLLSSLELLLEEQGRTVRRGDAVRAAMTRLEW